MTIALEEAKRAAERGEVPVGAVITCGNEIIASAGNRVIELKDASAHAEILAIRQAAQFIGNERLTKCDLYVTLEPCTMCAGAISQARIRRLYFGTEDAKAGAVENGVRFFGAPSCHHAPEVYSGFSAEKSAELLKAFFIDKRKQDEQD